MLSLWNVAHLCLDAPNFLNLISAPRHSILTLTSSIPNPNRTFIVVWAEVSSADESDFEQLRLYVCSYGITSTSWSCLCMPSVDLNRPAT